MVALKNQPLRGYNVTVEISGFDNRRSKNRPLWLQKLAALEDQCGSIAKLEFDDPRLIEIRRLQEAEANARNKFKQEKQRKLNEEWLKQKINTTHEKHK